VFGADRAVGHAVVLINIDRFLTGAAVFAVMEFYFAVALVVVFEDGDLVAFFDALQSVVVVPGELTIRFVVVVLPGDLVSRNANVAWASKNMSRLTLFLSYI